jgi:hypothetical protein
MLTFTVTLTPTIIFTATATLPPNVIDNLEDGDNNLNPTVGYGIGGYWKAWTWGDVSNQINSPYIICGNVGANGTSCAIHVFGNIKDNSDGQYPAFELDGIFGTGSYLDGTTFLGVRFYYKTGSADTCPFKRFNLPIAATSPVSMGGICTSNCFDHFGANLVATSDIWVQKKYFFNATLGSPALTRSGWGTIITPTTLTGTNLQQLLAVQWQEGRNGSSGTSYVDYWVDEVEFF